MKSETFHLELITPCFCGGAEPEKQAEIRASSIRGQLRWWFRTLGGFRSLARMSVREQENLIFGSAAGSEGRAGKLLIRVSGLAPSTETANDVALNATPGSPRGYLLFPLRGKARGLFNESAKVGPAAPVFTLTCVWRGTPTIADDIRALISVFGHLGALGFRSRRAMGALSFRSHTPVLADALPRFQKPEAIQVLHLPATGASDAIWKLANWLKGWRSYGRSGKNDQERQTLGFEYAKHDHDIACNRLSGSGYRPALGLPLLTKYGKWSWDKPEKPEGTKGRFASPVLLRPHKDAEGRWHALVIFVDAHKWPSGREVFLHGQPREVSLDLYEAMKKDPNLTPFASATST